MADEQAGSLPGAGQFEKKFPPIHEGRQGYLQLGVKKIRGTMGDQVELAKVAMLPHIWPEAPVLLDDEDDDGRTDFILLDHLG